MKWQVFVTQLVRRLFQLRRCVEALYVADLVWHSPVQFCSHHSTSAVDDGVFSRVGCSQVLAYSVPSHSQIKTPRIYLLNPTSLAKSHAIALLGTDLRVNNIDVCLIVESWFTKRHTDEFINIPEYVFRHDRGGRKGGGVCCYVHNNINSSVYAVSYKCEWLTFTFEGIMPTRPTYSLFVSPSLIILLVNFVLS